MAERTAADHAPAVEVEAAGIEIVAAGVGIAVAGVAADSVEAERAVAALAASAADVVRAAEPAVENSETVESAFAAVAGRKHAASRIGSPAVQPAGVAAFPRSAGTAAAELVASDAIASCSAPYAVAQSKGGCRNHLERTAREPTDCGHGRLPCCLCSSIDLR